MRTKLFPTQEEDVARIAGGIDIPNFSEPGTGKTLTAIAGVERLNMSHGLVVCPTIATKMWVDALEYELGAKAKWVKTEKEELDRSADFLVMSYDIMTAQVDSLLGRDNGIIIADEAHRLKTPGSKRTQAMFGELTDGGSGIYESGHYYMPLTGTPIERYADDLWAQLRACQPEALYKYGALSLDAFQRQFCRMEEKVYGQILKWVAVGTQNEKILNRMLYKEIGAIRRTFADVAPFMPPVTFRDSYIRIKVSKELKEELRGRTLEQIEERIQTAEGSTMCRLLGMAKVEEAAKYLIEEAKRDALLVGYWHDAVGTALVERLSKRLKVGRIGGSTLPTRREETKRQFLAGEIDVIVGQIAAMGEAMDGLQHRCRRVVFAEDHWSHSKIKQFYRRIERTGQKYPVQVEFLKADNPVDEAYKRVRERKRASAEEILVIHD